MAILDKRPTAIDQTFIPVENYGVKVVSMEMFKPERSDPVAYRGPLLHRVLEQLLSDAYWGDLDLLLLDLPPGTGDIAISLGQLIPTSEIIVVTTPQMVLHLHLLHLMQMVEVELVDMVTLVVD